MVKTHRWKKTALAAAAAALLSLCGTQASALSLGRITVQSALGEPLRAEIDVPDINTEEAASLKANPALPEVFRAAELEYNPAMTSLQIMLQKRADGRSFLRLSSSRVVNDPFVDMIIEVNWASGRIVRDYTMLFDPPSLRQAAPTAPTPAQLPARAFASKPTPAAPVAADPSALKTPGATRTPAKTAPAPAKTQGMESSRVTVKAGDTASKISELKKPVNVSLDQMLVALLRANPTAFVGNNVNRIKAGSVLDMPTTEQAESTPAAEATQMIVAQSKDFNDFRRKLAGNAPSTQLATADRKVNGSVQAQVEEKKPGLPTPDKLTLSKGAIKGQAAEDQLAKERSAKEAASRAAEIAKNIAELSKLGAASNAVTPGLAASAATPDKSNSVAITAAVAVPAPAASEPVLASSVPVLPASTAASVPAPTASAVAKKPKPIAVPVLEPEPGFVDELLENPLLPAGAGGLLAVLAGFGYYRFKQRKNAAKAEQTSLESRLQADSFYADMGGQLVDTADQPAASASMVYSSSQLDAVNDVDPVAEADVYLAYGRDLQAEEILKDALRTHPGRVAVHQKLLEIYAKRNDTQNFEETARKAFALTTGNGQDWDRICELGLSIDPTNTLYQPGGLPSEPNDQPSGSAPLEFTSSAVGALDNTPEDAPEGHALETTDLDLDLDLDFSLDDETSSAIPEAIAPPKEVEPRPLDLDFELTPETLPDAEPAPEPAKDTSHDIEFTLPDLDFELAGDRADPDTAAPTLDLDDFKLQDEASTTGSTPLDLLAEVAETETETPSPPLQDLSMLDFDLGSLSLELEETPAADSSAAEAAHEDPLGTKLALAEEFLAIGDDDGARALIEEVIAEATGDMKLKAQRALSKL